MKLVRPWHVRWGATDLEIAGPMPGDEIIPNANQTTRAISILRPSSEVWPWIAQIGYGRAGWYSYDWIDNDGRPSATRVIPELQELRVGDRIEMLPGWGPEVVEVVPGDHFVTGDREAGTWCLAAYRAGAGARLVSRWRQEWEPRGIASRFFTVLADPGAFVMEQKMLREIKKHVEASTDAYTDSALAAPRKEVV